MRQVLIPLVAGCVVLVGCASPSSPPVQPPVQVDVPVEREAAGCGGDGALGFDVDTLTRSVRTRAGVAADVAGVLVTAIVPDGPGDRAGLRVGDVLIDLGGRVLTSDCAFLGAAYGRDCEPVTATVLRAGARQTLTLTPVDALALSRRRCAAGDPAGCFRAGWILWPRSDNTVHRAEALALLERACREGSGPACGYLGHLLLEDDERRTESPAILERACALEDAAGCAHLAYLHATGTLRARDDARATALYEQSCALGDAEGCYNVGLNYAQGRGVTSDLGRAVAAYQEGCEGGSAKACTNLGYFHQHGRGVPLDLPVAFARYQQGCEGSACSSPNLLGCVNVGRAYRDGIGIVRDAVKAVAMFTRVCEGDIERDEEGATQMARACALLGGMHLGGTAPAADLVRGRVLSVRACDRGDGFGCFNAATAWVNGLGGPVDRALAATYFDHGCKAGDEDSCTEAAKLKRQ